MENRTDLLSSLSRDQQNIFELGYISFKSGKFKKSTPYLKESLKFFLKEKDFSSYARCIRMLMLALSEQQDHESLKQVREEFNRVREEFKLEKDPRILVLDRFYSLYLDKDVEKSFKSLGEALEIALQIKNERLKNNDRLGEIQSKLDLMDCLYAYANHYIEVEDFKKCKKELDNLKILIKDFLSLKKMVQLEVSKTNNSQEQQYFQKILQLIDREKNYVLRMDLNADFMMAIIDENPRSADCKLWNCYEKASSGDNDYLIPYILTQMALNYYNLNELEQSLTFLNLSEKHLDAENFKLLAKKIEQLKRRLDDKKEKIKDLYDIVFDKEERSIFEKQKGCINFKNQFILIDLLKLFISDPGSTYSKKTLVERVWKQSYSPEVHDNKIYVTIKRLRELIEPDINKPRYIFRNKNGYYLTEQAKILIK